MDDISEQSLTEDQPFAVGTDSSLDNHTADDRKRYQSASPSATMGYQQEGHQEVDGKRRAFTAASLGSPVLISMLSRPAFGQTACSISGLMSGNVSSPGGVPAPCAAGGFGCTPGFWKNNPLRWKETVFRAGSCVKSANGVCLEYNLAGGTTLASVLGFTPPLVQPDATMMEVLMLTVKGSDGGVNHAGLAHWVAALLNASAFPLEYGSSVADVVGAIKAAYIDGMIGLADLHATLQTMNERGCPLDAGAAACPSQGNIDYVCNEQDDCIPICGIGERFDENKGNHGSCVIIP